MSKLDGLQSPCRLCPRECRARRAEGIPPRPSGQAEPLKEPDLRPAGGELGHCGVAADAVVASAGPHFGEESCLVARGGSGTIFLGGCNLLCLFCQNAGISHGRRGRTVSVEELAGIMLRLEGAGCENVNFVTPTHFAPQIAEGVRLARGKGLRVPVVYNCGGYEAVEALKELDGLVEIYMPDAKTLDGEFARATMAAPDYPERMREALLEMQRQVGDLVIERGRALKGLLIRHLVMPGMLEDTRNVIDFLARDVSSNAFVNVMGQYRPCHRSREVPGLDRKPTRREFEAARGHAKALGLRLAR